MKQVGALWEKSKGKEKFLSGRINLGLLGEINIGVFPNEKKDEKQPDYRVIIFDD